jgi:phosphatidylserine/phosphatidylglycerophosphate/cardiolipin synthase-like enzyme
MNNKNGLKIAEYISLGMSFVGLTIAGITQQFMFALAPFSLNLSIGTIRRQKLELEAKSQTAILQSQIPGTESLTYQDLDKVARTVRLLESNIATRIDGIDNIILSRQNIDGLIQVRVDESFDRQLQLLESNLTTRMDSRILSSEDIERSIQDRIDRSLARQFETIEKILPKQDRYTLISGRGKSREVFLDALQQSKHRIILVCPWLTNYAINENVRSLIISALNRGVTIDIGWGHLKDVNNQPSRLSQSELLKSDRWKYNAIPWLDKLQSQYPHLLTLKVLGTHEKFLVCDRQFAMLGSHNYLTSGDNSNERELGIKTDNPEIINELIELFDLERPT